MAVRVHHHGAVVIGAIFRPMRGFAGHHAAMIDSGPAGSVHGLAAWGGNRHMHAGGIRRFVCCDRIKPEGAVAAGPI